MSLRLRNYFTTAVVFLSLLLLITGCGKTTTESGANQDKGTLEDGSYQVYVSMEGGSGRASVTSPAEFHVEDGQMTALLEWSSSHYDYMKVDGVKYEPVNTEGNSIFEVPVASLDQPLTMIADTTAMSTAHEIEYQFTFSLEDKMGDSSDMDSSGDGSDSDDLSVDKDGVNADSGSVGETGSTGENGAAGEFKKMDPSTISKELTYDHTMELSYAKEFQVDYYQDGYALIQIAQDGAFLLVPEGKEAPADVSDNIRIIKQPLNNVYMVASACMDMFRSMDALDQVRFTGTKKENWNLPEVVDAMDQGDLLYAGKYSAPDYERILAEKCNLVIENTMIYHTPSVKEQLERFGITVMVDHSSYEAEPLARTEWVKLYGLLTGKEEEAQKAFQGQVDAFAKIEDEKKEGATVAFFYFTNDGQVNVRSSYDYLPKMIAMAGGTYAFEDLGDADSNTSTISMQMEEFYTKAKDADYMIYNSTTVGELSSLNDLLEKNSLLSKCKAVVNGHVYCTSNNLYQSSMELGTIVGDFQKMLNGETGELTYLYPLE